MTPPSPPPPAVPPEGAPRWRQRTAGVLLLIGGITLLASYFLPWSSGAQVPGRDTWPTCTPDVFNNSAWSLINPFTVNWDSTLLEIVVPVAFALLGWRLLARATPVRLRWRLLVILYCPPELFLALVLYSLTTWDSPVTLHPAIGFFVSDPTANAGGLPATPHRRPGCGAA
jgi:hypothetical protein